MHIQGLVRWWFALLVAVIVEAGIHGGANAAPITRDVLKAYFDKKTRASLPNPTNLAALLKLKR